MVVNLPQQITIKSQLKINIMKNQETLTATPNHKNKTFTLRVWSNDWNGVHYTKYRTIPLSKEEFNSCLYNTDKDWNNFLRSSDYTIITSKWLK